MSALIAKHQDFLVWLKEECGYLLVLPLTNTHYVAIARFVYTHAIIIGQYEDRVGMDDRWCYHSYQDALTALLNWDGQGEPQGWHRHPATGRRRPDGDASKEYINE